MSQEKDFNKQPGSGKDERTMHRENCRMGRRKKILDLPTFGSGVDRVKYRVGRSYAATGKEDGPSEGFA
jgi:hypothetical protein